ncbi:hypothetical protein [Maribacter algarum]|nr:hypothetical protein [Maribacter algarum]
MNSGISESDIEYAVSKSGYPLQTVISDKLRNQFMIKEEWSFLDLKTKEIRAIDILAELLLWDFEKGQPRVRPQLNLLIECKQSELPYVFFLSNQQTKTQDYPVIGGLFNKGVTLSTDDTGSTFSYSLKQLLDIDKHEFFSAAPTCVTFSKCVRKGKNIVLSGTDGYQNIVLPIISSLHDYKETEKPKETALYFDAHITFGIGVLDAPMIGITVNENGHDQELIPWVRVFRHESFENEDSSERKKLYAIDLIHKDFLDTFINQHLLPFAEDFSEKIKKHHIVIATGKGFAKGLDENSWENVEPRLEKGKIPKFLIGKNPFKNNK